MPFKAKTTEHPKTLDDRGNRTFIEGGNQIPVKIERACEVTTGEKTPCE